MNRSIPVLILLVTLMAASCNSGPSGLYADKDGVFTLDFKSDGKVYVGTMGIETEMTYEVNDNKIKIVETGNILTIEDENTLSGPLGIKFYRYVGPGSE